MDKKDNSYFPTDEMRKNAWVNSREVYQEAEKDPIRFWEKLAQELFWFKKWERTFSHQPPYFQWFLSGKTNLAANVFENNPAGFENIKDKTALIWEPEPPEEPAQLFTYGQLSKQVNKFANGLKRQGVQKGDRVGIYLPVIPEIVIAMLACVKIGAVHTVVFSAFSPEALKVRLQGSQAKALITADGYFRRGQVVNLKKAVDLGIEETNIEKVIVVKRAGNEIAWDVKKDIWWSDVIQPESDVCQSEQMDSEDLLFLLATSGSTGKPKQVMHTCGGYMVQAFFTAKWIFDLKDTDIFWCTSDPGWITGHTYTIYAPLLNASTTLLFEGAPDWPTPDRWAQIIEKHKVTIFYTAPTAIRMFEKYGVEVLQKHKFETLRLLGSVGEPIDETAWLWYFKEIGQERCPIVDTWWQTETGGILISSLPGIGPFKPTFTGLPFPGVRVDVLDDKGEPCAPEQEGNLVVLPPFPPGLLRGLYQNPEKYLQTYWSQYGLDVYFTSDGAFRDKDGLVRILGRVDDVIKVAGHRVATGELENAIVKHPQIAEAAVVGVPDPIKGEVPVAFIVPSEALAKEGCEKMKKEVIDQIRKEIGPIALPKEVYSVEDLPKTRSGKIMRRILRRMFTGEPLGDLSTLSNPEIVERIRERIYENK